MANSVFTNYDAFYNMVLSTTLLANTKTPEWVADSEKIIRFIGEAYKLQSATVDKFLGIITENLTPLALTSDRSAVFAKRSYNGNFADADAIFDIKSSAIFKIQSITEFNSPDINPDWFDYRYYKAYQAEMRFAILNTTASTGELLSTRQVGIMLALGIGCKQDVTAACNRFMQCAYWGDVPSIYYLAYAYKLAGDEASSATFTEVAKLAKKYMMAGYTVVPENEQKQYSNEAIRQFVCISSIRQDIVNALQMKRIDLSFIEAITSKELDYHERLSFINSYESKGWREITNASYKPLNLGFN